MYRIRKHFIPFFTYNSAQILPISTGSDSQTTRGFEFEYNTRLNDGSLKWHLASFTICLLLSSGDTEPFDYTHEAAATYVSVFEARNVAFKGSFCTEGDGIGVVVRTGKYTVSQNFPEIVILERVFNVRKVRFTFFFAGSWRYCKYSSTIKWNQK